MKGEEREEDDQQSERWMNSVTEVMDATLGDLEEQVRDISFWRKYMWFLGVKNDLIACNQLYGWYKGSVIYMTDLDTFIGLPLGQ